MRRFYELLNDDPDYSDWKDLNFSLVRVETHKGVKHVKGNDAYFLPDELDSFPNGANIVKKDVYIKTLKKVTFSGNAKEFLKNIGVREFDEKAAIELRLKFYDEYQPDTINKEYYEDIKQLFHPK
jgi:hypothetical protein